MNLKPAESTDLPSAAMALHFHAERQWRGVGDPDRWIKDKIWRGPSELEVYLPLCLQATVLVLGQSDFILFILLARLL